MQRPDREVGVPDHVLEQHHPSQRRAVEIVEDDARQFDDAAAEAAGDFVLVLDEDRVARADRLLRRRVDVHDVLAHALVRDVIGGPPRAQRRMGTQVVVGVVGHEAPARPVARPNRSSATRSIDNSLGGIFLHW